MQRKCDERAIRQAIARRQSADAAVVCGCAGVCGGVSYSAHWNRQLLNDLYAELSVRDKAQAEWGRLILEQSTWTAHNRIETLATERLSMRIPDAAEVRMVAP